MSPRVPAPENGQGRARLSEGEREAERGLAAAEGEPATVDRSGTVRPRKATSDEAAAQRRLALLSMGGLLMLAILAGAIGLWATSSGNGGYAPPPGAHAEPLTATRLPASENVSAALPVEAR